MALTSSTQPSLRGQVVVRFPANVVAGNGIEITKTGQTYEFAVDDTSSLVVNSEDVPPIGGNSAIGISITSHNIGVFVGSGEPTLSAGQGSLYLRSDGDATNNRAYINIDGGVLWTALLTEL